MKTKTKQTQKQQPQRSTRRDLIDILREHSSEGCGVAR